MKDKSIAIVGTVGVPANYGGFETLAENLVKYHDAVSLPDLITVYCSRSYPSRERRKNRGKVIFRTPLCLSARYEKQDIRTELSS